MNAYDTPELWKDPQRIEENLANIGPGSIFVYHRFTAPFPCAVQYVTNYWFDTLEEAVAYIKHIPLLSAIEENGGVEKYMEHIEKINRVTDSANPKAEIKKYLNLFNKEFAHTYSDHEVHICFGFDEFRDMRIEQYKEWECDDELDEFLAVAGGDFIDSEDLSFFLLNHNDC